LTSWRCFTEIGRKVENELAVDHEIIVGFAEITREHFCKCQPSAFIVKSCETKLTITTDFQVYDTANTDVDDTKKTLVLLLELLLVKDLNRQYTFVTRSPVRLSALRSTMIFYLLRTCQSFHSNKGSMSS